MSQPSIRKTINKASEYYRYRVLNIPLPEEYPLPNTLNIDNRIAYLENALRQIANICSPLITENNQIVEKVGENEYIDADGRLNLDDNYDDVSSEPEPTITTPTNVNVNIVADYLEVTEEELYQNYDNPHIITDEDDYGKLVTIIEAFQVYDFSIKLDHLTLGKRKLPLHLLIVKDDRQFVVGFLNVGGNAFTPRIKNFNELASSYPKIKFHLIRDEREGAITGKVGIQEIDKLNYLKKGSFMMMNRDNRVVFELIYKMIVDSCK